VILTNLSNLFLMDLPLKCLIEKHRVPNLSNINESMGVTNMSVRD